MRVGNIIDMLFAAIQIFYILLRDMFIGEQRCVQPLIGMGVIKYQYFTPGSLNGHVSKKHQNNNLTELTRELNHPRDARNYAPARPVCACYQP